MVFNIATISSCNCLFMDCLHITPIFLCQPFSDTSKHMSTHFNKLPKCSIQHTDEGKL